MSSAISGCSRTRPPVGEPPLVLKIRSRQRDKPRREDKVNGSVLLAPAVSQVGELAHERIERSSVTVSGLEPRVLELAVISSQLIDGYLSIDSHASPTVNHEGP